MKNKLLIINVLISLIFQTTSFNLEEIYFNVQIHFVDDNNISLKEITKTYRKGEDVIISKDELTIENYEIDSIDHDANVYEKDDSLVIDSIQSDKEITIHLIATASYTVNYYLEENDTNTLLKSVTKTGKVGGAIPKSEDIEEIQNYTYIGNSETTIEGDNSSSVDIFYGLSYYRITFDLNGGTNGPEDIYEQYGFKIENLKEPIKNGYIFTGWYQDAECTQKIDTDNLEVTSDITYYAGYKKNENKALITINYYGENANDNNYSLIGSETTTYPIGEVYTFDSLKENEHFHKHDLTCYGVSDTNPVTLSDFELNGFKKLSNTLENGYVYLRVDNHMLGHDDYFYLRMDDKFYKTDIKHISYQVGETEKLKDKLYDDEFMLFKPITTCNSEYVFDHADSIVVKEENNVVNIYLKRIVYCLTFGESGNYPNKKYGYIEAKWGQDIYKAFNTISNDDKYGWRRFFAESEGLTKFLTTMPKENINYYRSVFENEGLKHINYLVKDNDTYYQIYATDWSILKATIPESAFIEFDGYVINQDKSIKAGDYFAVSNTNNIYYDPKTYDLVLMLNSSKYEIFKIAYKDNLASASSYIPSPTYNYQVFAGWYLNSNFEGNPIKLNETLMPSHNLTLYAKWINKEYDVRFIDSKKNIDVIIKVEYGNTVSDIPLINDSNFIGWVKDDSTRNVIKLDNYQIKENTTLYALYKEDRFINYTINYLTYDNEIVANSTHGSIIKGNKLYITSKKSNELKGIYKGEYEAVESNYVNTVDETNNNFNLYYVPITKYNITLKPTGLEINDSLIINISGKGFNNLEIPINKETVITGFYKDESYSITFNNDYSYTYQDLEPISFVARQNETFNITLNKQTNDFFKKETRLLNTFNKYEQKD